MTRRTGQHKRTAGLVTFLRDHGRAPQPTILRCKTPWLLGWLTFEDPLPVPEKAFRQHRRTNHQRRQLEGKDAGLTSSSS